MVESLPASGGSCGIPFRFRVPIPTDPLPQDLVEVELGERDPFPLDPLRPNGLHGTTLAPEAPWEPIGFHWTPFDIRARQLLLTTIADFKINQQQRCTAARPASCSRESIGRCAKCARRNERR